MNISFEKHPLYNTQMKRIFDFKHKYAIVIVQKAILREINKVMHTQSKGVFQWAYDADDINYFFEREMIKNSFETPLKKELFEDHSYFIHEFLQIILKQQSSIFSPFVLAMSASNTFEFENKNKEELKHFIDAKIVEAPFPCCTKIMFEENNGWNMNCIKPKDNTEYINMIICDLCLGEFHYYCINMQKSLFDEITSSEEKPWICPKCTARSFRALLDGINIQLEEIIESLKIQQIFYCDENIFLNSQVPEENNVAKISNEQKREKCRRTFYNYSDLQFHKNEFHSNYFV